MTGNLYHHAIEMLLKARLSQSMALASLGTTFRHRLKPLWNTFKAQFPSAGLEQFDALVEALDRFERIRYPDELIAKGAELVIAMHRKAATSTGQQGGTAPPRYEVVVSELDELVAEILKVSSRNPMFLSSGLNDYAREALRYENPVASIW